MNIRSAAFFDRKKELRENIFFAAFCWFWSQMKHLDDLITNSCNIYTFSIDDGNRGLSMLFFLCKFMLVSLSYLPKVDMWGVAFAKRLPLNLSHPLKTSKVLYKSIDPQESRQNPLQLLHIYPAPTLKYKSHQLVRVT